MGFIENGRQGEEETERRHAVVYNDHGNLVKALRTPWSPWSVVCGAAPQLIPTPLLQPRARQPEHLRRSRITRVSSASSSSWRALSGTAGKVGVLAASSTPTDDLDDLVARLSAASRSLDQRCWASARSATSQRELCTARSRLRITTLRSTGSNPIVAQINIASAGCLPRQAMAAAAG